MTGTHHNYSPLKFKYAIQIAGGVRSQLTITLSIDDDNEVAQGDTTTLTCSYTGKASDNPLWRLGFNHGPEDPVDVDPIPLTRIAHFYLYTTPDNPNPIYEPPFSEPAYVMTIDNVDLGTSGSSQLTINFATLTDARRYWCQVNIDTEILYADANLTVIVPLQTVVLSNAGQNYENGSSVTVFDGFSHKFKCIATAGNPAASIGWKLANQPTDADGESEEKTNVDDPNLFDTESTKTIIPSFNAHHRRNVECKGWQSNAVSSVYSFVSLDIFVPPSDINQVKISDQTNPSGYPQGATVDVIEGNQHVFTCDVFQTRPSANIEWFIDNIKVDTGITTPVPPSNGDNLEDTSGSIKFTPTRSQHKKTLECRVSIDVTGAPGAIARNIVLNVYGPPDKPSIEGQNMLVEGMAETFTCNALNAFPEGGIEWYIGNTNITDRIAENEQDTSDFRYDISSEVNFMPSRANNGEMIKCDVVHETLTGSEERSNSLMVDVQFCAENVLISNTCPVEIREGISVDLTCSSSSSNPQTTLIWSKGGTPVPNTPSPVYEDGEYGGTTTTLTYSGQFTRGDTGTDMMCCGTIPTMSCNQCDSCLLNVLYPPESVTITKSTDDPVVENSYVYMVCSAAGNPQPNIFAWEQDNKITDHTTNTVVYDNVSRDNAGYYTCIANNGLSPDGRSEDTPLVIHYAAQISNKDENQVGVEEGDDVSLVCIADALPAPAFTWLNPDGMELTNATERVTITSETMKEDGVHGTEIKSMLNIAAIDSDKDYGGYTCIANNNIGSQDMFVIYVNGTTVPTVVSDLHTVNTTVTEIEISWSPGYAGGTNLEQTSYVAHRVKTSDEDWTEEQSDTENDHVIKGLEPDTTYEIRVVAENRIGRSPAAFTEATTKANVAPPEPPKTSNIGAILGSTMGVIIAVLLVIIFYLLRKQHGDTFRDHEPGTGSTKLQLTGTARASSNETRQHDGTRNSGFVDTDLNEQVEEPYVKYLLKQFIFPRENLHIQNELGHGEFGKVLLGMATGIVVGERETKVAVKTLKDNANDETKQQLMKEFNQMKSLMPALVKQKNRNVVQLLGGCMDEDPPYMILEYMENGNLKTRLRESRTIGDGTYGNLFAGSKSFTPTQLMGFAHQVANGMAFLARQKCIHRDLAARNVLLNKRFECKVSDFGLAEDIKNVEVFHRQNECRLPIRWMAIESILGDVHTTESDVWSFGVLLWEIVTLGSRPYPKLKGDDIRKLLKNGQRMPRPKHCSEQLYNIMLACWEKEPSKRPSFEHLMKLLNEVLEGQNSYLSLADFETKLYEDVSFPAPNEKV
ncbi:uncharacterized protein [Amphiura filiformis]|uniref:uncharacterized protein n=1 Tax=Amphiura filiformis TaxID=82378 RepID=UPI003B20D89D